MPLEKLRLARETIRRLEEAEAERAVGGRRDYDLYTVGCPTAVITGCTLAECPPTQGPVHCAD